MTVLEFITQSAIIASVIEQGQTLSPEESASILIILNNLLDSWSAERLDIYTVGAGTYALTAGTGLYPIGTAAPVPFNVTRPTFIESANVIVNGAVSTDIQIVDSVEWSNITDRNMTAKQPLKLYCDYAYPISTVSVWPKPSSNCQIEIFSWRSPAPFVFAQNPGALPSETPAVQEALTAAIAGSAKAVIGPSFVGNLVAGQASYQMGPGAADFNTERPLLIQSAQALMTAPLRHPLRLISSQEWATVQERLAQSSRPLELYNDNAYPTANLNLWPVPTAAATTLELFTWTVLTQFASLAPTVAFPTGYMEPLQYGLAVRLPSAFGLALDPTVAQIATDSRTRLRSLNAQTAQMQSGQQQIQQPAVPTPAAAA